MKADRARQFLPFAALRGFDGMLREIEKQSVPKKELTEEELRLLNQKIKSIGKGSNICIVHYEKSAYTETKGTVSFIDPVFRRIFVGEKSIFFDNIQSISDQ